MLDVSGKKHASMACPSRVHGEVDAGVPSADLMDG